MHGGPNRPAEQTDPNKFCAGCGGEAALNPLQAYRVFLSSVCGFVGHLTIIYAVTAFVRQGGAAGLHYTGSTVKLDTAGGISAPCYGRWHLRALLRPGASPRPAAAPRIHAPCYGSAHSRTVWSFA